MLFMHDKTKLHFGKPAMFFRQMTRNCLKVFRVVFDSSIAQKFLSLSTKRKSLKQQVYAHYREPARTQKFFYVAAVSLCMKLHVKMRLYLSM